MTKTYNKREREAQAVKYHADQEAKIYTMLDEEELKKIMHNGVHIPYYRTDKFGVNAKRRT